MIQPPTITQTHHSQSGKNLAILNHVVAVGSASFTDLAALFMDAYDNEADRVRARARLSKRLENMVYHRRLRAVGRGNERTYRVGPEAFDRPATPSFAVVTRTSLHVQEEVVPHDQISRLTVTVLPTRAQVLRPGALDFKRVASYGFRC